jgi:hypothetical protein
VFAARGVQKLEPRSMLPSTQRVEPIIEKRCVQ